MELQNKIRGLFLGRKSLQEIEKILEITFEDVQNIESDILNLKPRFKKNG